MINKRCSILLIVRLKLSKENISKAFEKFCSVWGSFVISADVPCLEAHSSFRPHCAHVGFETADNTKKHLKFGVQFIKSQEFLFDLVKFLAMSEPFFSPEANFTNLIGYLFIILTLLKSQTYKITWKVKL